MSNLPDLQPYADRLKVNVHALRALIDVESSGRGLENGIPVIRLEVHLLWRAVGISRRAAVDARFHVLGPASWQGHRFLVDSTWLPLHQGQIREWMAFFVAKEIDQDAAIMSTSWGLGQVLGIHWKRLGYESPMAFMAAQMGLEGQLDTLVRYIASQRELARALRNERWMTVGMLYNGGGQAVEYAARLAARFNALKAGAR